MNRDTVVGAGHAGAAFALWFVVCAVSWFFGMQPNPALIALVIVAAWGAVLLLLDTLGDAAFTDGRPVADHPVRSPGEDPGLTRLARIINGHLVAHDVGDQLHRHLVALVDQRLMAHHGVSHVVDPERAAQLMGPVLAQFTIETDPYPRMTPDQIDVLIDRIEEL